MTDTSLPNSHQPNPSSSSYVDSYTPPSPAASTLSDTTSTGTPPTTASPSTHDPLAELEKALQEYEARQKQLSQKTQETVQKTQTTVHSTPTEDPLAELERVLDEYEAKYKQQSAGATPTSTPQPVKPTPMAAPSPASPAPVSAAPPVQKAEKQSIEDQNIFELLGVADADSNEKEAFLDELQTALWEDFLDKDLVLLVTADQLQDVQILRAQTTLSENERQEKLIQKVESLVPDIEEIMLEKALELKEDMVRERLIGMKEYYASRPNDMAKIQEAEKHILAGQWRSGAQLLNTLTA